MVYVLSDVHGRIDRFESILHQIDLNEDDRLYVLGDVIDRNAGGIELLFRLMRMRHAAVGQSRTDDAGLRRRWRRL